ncbi:MAG: hypothetical protein A3D52_01275 [Candidatus Taylorbacteria bacterium RIFCSPHIGHO2_02_FULL_44_36]|nr:MAG: hypothetical protein A3D52_01275 [Candidatus Taylorbacteria bacterium RIFCSPHIGHO2_02_FULL_44_36]
MNSYVDVAHSIRALSLTDFLGSRPPLRFSGPNKCPFCGTRLSSYNPLEICNCCLKKTQTKFVKENSTVVSPKIAYRTRLFPKLPRRKALPRRLYVSA